MLEQKNKKILFLSVIFFVAGFLHAANAKADTICQTATAANTSCTMDADSNGGVPGTCVNGACVANGTALNAQGAPSTGAIVNNTIPGNKDNIDAIISCGRAGQQMCTLCDLIAGLNYVIQYIMKISIGVGLLAFTIAGVMYIVSGGDSGLTGKAKTVMKNAVIGFVVVFGAWLIVNTAIMSLGSRTKVDANGVTQATFGMTITSWGEFTCGPGTN